MPDTQPAPGLQLKKATPHCGAEVAGIDLSAPLDSETLRALELALAEHGVLFFRDQSMTPDQHKALGRRFGELHFHPAYPDLLEGHPEIMVIKADANFGASMALFDTAQSTSAFPGFSLHKIRFRR